MQLNIVSPDEEQQPAVTTGAPAVAVTASKPLGYRRRGRPAAVKADAPEGSPKITLPGQAEVPLADQPAPASAKKRKIAIVGTAPQWQAAPFNDLEWEIWGILGISTTGMRLTRLYELHPAGQVKPMIEAPPHKGKYWEVARALKENFISRDKYPEAPEGTQFNFQAKLDKYGPYFASSAAWMIADAIDCDPEAIAIYGVNMAHESEYGYQKPSCTYMLGYAKAKGIKLIMPSSSELLAVPYQYGLEPAPRAIECFSQKELEYQGQLAAHTNNLRASEMGKYGAEQALAVIQWFKQNWHTPDKTTPAFTPAGALPAPEKG